MNTVKFELNFSFVVLFCQFEIQFIFIYETSFADFLIGLVFREFPVDDADFVLISQDQVEPFELFLGFFPHPLFRVHDPVIIGKDFFANDQTQCVENFVEIVLKLDFLFITGDVPLEGGHVPNTSVSL